MGVLSFFELLERRVRVSNSLLCIGLDPHLADLQSTLPDVDLSEAAKEFCIHIINSTKHVAAAYKPNAAFFEALGPKGIAVLKYIVQEVIPKDIPCIFDAKRGDISTTADAYALAAFEQVQAGSITLHPYMGHDSVLPFITKQHNNKACFIVCKTSNPGAADFQTLELANGELLYEMIARRCVEWNQAHGNIGLVVGSTDFGIY